MDGRLSMERSSKTNLQVIYIILGPLPNARLILFFSFPPCDRESNCFMVPSKAETKNAERNSNRKEPIQVTESDENETVAFAETNGHTNGATDSNGTTNGTTNGSNPNDSPSQQNEEAHK